jgi:hypothetical protein
VKNPKFLRLLGLVAGFIVLALSFASNATAQTATGTIMGRVTDPSGAAVPGVNVTITEQNTGVPVKVKAATDGNYSVPFLKPGTYSVVVEASGFQRAERTNMILQVQAILEADFQLQIGVVSQKVSVVSEIAPVLQTASTEQGNVIDEQATQQLPLNGRNFSSLAVLAPGTNGGAQGNTQQTGGGNEMQRGGASVVANGGRDQFNDYLIDGLDDRDVAVGGIKVLPNLEGIEEFKDATGNYNAEFASGGAVVQVISRGGSNVIHGSAFEFFRNAGVLDARNELPFAPNVTPYYQNQWGGAVGGPIRKDKTFFFFDFQGFEYNKGSLVTLSEPTAAEEQGNFTAVPDVIYDPTTYNATTNTRTCFGAPNPCTNIIPTARLNQEAQNILPVYAPPNLSGIANNLTYDDVSDMRQTQFDVRIDHTVSPQDSFFARVTDGTSKLLWPGSAPYPSSQNGGINPYTYTGTNRANYAPSGQGTAQWTHIFSPTLINEFALGYTRFGLRVVPSDQGEDIATKVGITGANTCGICTSMTTLAVSNITEVYPANSVPEVVPQNAYQLNDTLAYVHGAHSMKFGFQGIHELFGFEQLGSLDGSLSFTGVYTNNPASSKGTGWAFADFMLGLPVSWGKGVYVQGTADVHYTEAGVFVQDQWRLRPNLTFNWGVRYDIFTPPVEKYNRQSDFDPVTGLIDVAGQNGWSRGMLDEHHDNISPRVGFAYTVTPKTVVRAAYGLFFFNEQGTGGSARLFIANPFASSFSFTCSATVPCLSTTNGIPSYTTGSASATAVYLPKENQSSSVNQWNLAIQRQLNSTTYVEVAYVGNKGTHLNIALNGDTPVPGAGSLASREPYPAYSSISTWQPIGNSSFNGMEISAQHRWAQGIWFFAQYTWSKSLDYGGGGNSNNSESRLNVQNQYDVDSSYSYSDFNYPSRFTLGHMLDLPVGRGRKFLTNAHGVEDAILGGWALRGIVTLQSGPPLTTTMNTSTANTGTEQYPNRVCNGTLPASQRSLAEWFNTACYTTPANYTWGNAARNIIVGPGLTDWDASLAKDFKLTEKLGMTFRWEWFNAFNTPNWGDPNTSIGASTVGEITSTSNARICQFAVRFHW